MAERKHILFGWTWIFVGFVMGLALGMFAFNGPVVVPPQFMDYASLPRRLLRLSHISFIGLGFLNWMYGVTLSSLQLPNEKRTSFLLIFGSVTMSVILLISAFFVEMKYALAIPALSLTAAAGLFVWQLMRSGAISAKALGAKMTSNSKPRIR